MIFESVALNAAIIIVLIVALSLDYLTKFFSYWYVRHIPYERPVPAFGSDLRRVFALADTTDVAADLYRRYPDHSSVGYIKSRIPDLLIRDPDTIKLILDDHFEHFRNRGLCLAGSGDRSIRDNLFYNEGELWSALRSRMKGFFEVEASWEAMCERARRNLKNVLPAATSECDMRKLTNTLTEGMLHGCIFGDGVLTPADEKLVTRLADQLRSHSYAARIRKYFMSIFPSLYVLFNMSRIDGSLVQSLKDITSRVSSKVGEGTLVQYLWKQMAAGPMDVTAQGRTARKGRPRVREFDEDVATAQVVSSLAEGALPCGVAAAMTLYELARHPGALADVLRELDSGGSGEEGGALASAVDETLRLHPSHSVLSRVCVVSYKIPGSEVLIDKGVTVTIPVAALHRDSKYYKDPDAFDPRRFRSEEVQKRHPYTYLPFGAGPRGCLGLRLARRWTRACVAGVLRAHSVAPCARTPSALRPARTAFSSTLPAELWLTLTPRSTSNFAS